MKKFREKLSQLEQEHRYRSLRLPAGIDLTSNDYLGLREHPLMREAAIEALQNGIDVGAGGSRLLRGHTNEHQDLEEFAADFLGYDASLFFASGFQANYALFTTLPDRHDLIIFDELVHASVRDGIKASNAASVKILHNDLNEFEAALKRADCKGQIYIAVESVYSMDGDVAPLKELYALAKQYNAILIADEAHATGVFGANGKGLAEDLPRENLITLHTCGKALGVSGGLVCAERTIIEYLINAARPFIYSTAPMPLQAVLVQRALEIVRDEPGRRVELFKLQDAANQFLSLKSQSQIIPIVIGDSAKAVEISMALADAGFDIRAIRPPTVAEGTARLRLSLSTSLNEKILKDFASHLLPLLQDKAA